MRRPFISRASSVSFMIGLVVLASGQTGPSVSLTLQATTVERALKILSDQVQLPLLASVQTAQEVLAIRFQKVPLQEAMGRIADGVDGTWKKEGKGFRLVRTAQQSQAETNQEFGAAVQKIRESVKKMLERENKLPSQSPEDLDRMAARLSQLIKRFDPQSPTQNNWYQESAKINDQSPINRALTRLIAKMDPEELASIPIFMTGVWSTNPTAVQHSMNPEMEATLMDFVRTQQEWNSALDRHGVSNPKVNGTTYYLGDYGDPDQPTSRAFKIGSVLLAVRNMGPVAGLGFDLMTFDEAGMLISEATTSLGDEYEDLAEASLRDESSADEPLIHASDDWKAMLAVSREASYAVKPLAPNLLNMVLKPDYVDPLSYMVSPLLIQAAEIRKVNMVACLCDSSAYVGFLGEGRDVSVRQLLERVKYSRSTVELKDGWLTVKPKNPAYSRSHRTDRRVLAQYLQRLYQQRSFSIDESAFYALSLPDHQLNYLPIELATLVAESDRSNNNLDMLRLWATFTDEQRNRLEEGELSLDTFSEEQMAIVNRMVYGISGGLEFTLPLDRRAGAEMRPIDWQLHRSGILREPTESLPNGIPPHSILRCKIQRMPVVVSPEQNRNPDGYQVPRMSVRELAFYRFESDHPEIFGTNAKQSRSINYSNLFLGQQLLMKFVFQFTSSLTVTQSVVQNSIDSSRVLTVGDLPEDLRRQFLDAYAGYEKSYSKARPTSNYGGTGPVPPPR